MVKTNCVKTVQ